MSVPPVSPPLPDYLEEALKRCCVSYDPAFIDADDALRAAIRRYASEEAALLREKQQAILDYFNEQSQFEYDPGSETIMVIVSKILGKSFPDFARGV